MPSLLDAQLALRDVLVGPVGRDAPEWVCAGGGNAAERLDVYRNTLAGTCVRALGLAFPTVSRLVGREFFEGAAQIFAQGHPPAAPDLNAYGIGFPEFLEGFAPCASLAYLPDVARLDWAVVRALNAPDMQPLALDALADLPEAAAASLRFRAHPSVTVLRSEFPVDQIWQTVLLQDDEGMAAVDLAAGPVHLVVQRTGDAPRVLRLSERDWRFATGLFDGRPLEALLEEFGDAMPTLLAEHLTAARLTAFSQTA